MVGAAVVVDGMWLLFVASVLENTESERSKRELNHYLNENFLSDARSCFGKKQILSRARVPTAWINGCSTYWEVPRRLDGMLNRGLVYGMWHAFKIIHRLQRTWMIKRQSRGPETYKNGRRIKAKDGDIL